MRFFMGTRVRTLVWGIVLGTAGCGGATPPAEGASSPTSDEPAPPVASEPEPAHEANEDEEASAPAQDAGEAESALPPQRELTYRVRSGALTIEVDDIEFDASAKAVRSGRGFGVEVKVVAKLTGEGTRSVLSPPRGPLAFAGTVRGDLFTDKREGDGEQVLTADAPLTFTRTWPDSGTKPLATGEELELRVGLWGLGRDSKSRQPIQQFFTVKMKGGKKESTPIVEPPAAFMGE